MFIILERTIKLDYAIAVNLCKEIPFGFNMLNLKILTNRNKYKV